MRRVTTVVSSILALLATTQPANAAAISKLRWPAIKGWKPPSEQETFDKKTIWQAIDGAAEIYIAYGFERMFHAEYKRGKIHAVVQVYDQSQPINAFGVFGRERPGEAKAIKGIGGEAVAVPPHQCLMIKARYYVKVQANSGKLTVEHCRQLLGPISARLPGDSKPPKELSLLPTRGRVAGSLGFTRRSYLGLGALQDCLHARYKIPSQKGAVELFVVLGDSASRAALWKKLSGKGESAKLVRRIPYRGSLLMVRIQRGMFGITGAGGDVGAAGRRLAELLGLQRLPAASRK